MNAYEQVVRDHDHTIRGQWFASEHGSAALSEAAKILADRFTEHHSPYPPTLKDLTREFYYNVQCVKEEMANPPENGATPLASGLPKTAALIRVLDYATHDD